jgi:hypothetical protein
MNVIIYPFLVLASFAFTAVLCVHAAALAGSTQAFNALMKFLLPGVFVVMLPTIFVMNRLTRDFKQKDIWKAALRGCPLWMQRGHYVLWGYAFFAAFVLPFAYGGGMHSAPNTAREMSALTLVPYGIVICVLYSATRADRFDQSRRCAKGHCVAPLAKYCEECGAPGTPASPKAPESSR